nr:hypothetical protein [Geodermatophilus normandii]
MGRAHRHRALRRRGLRRPGHLPRLAEVLDDADRVHGTAGGRVYYFATPPRLFDPIAVSLGKAGLGTPAGPGVVRAVIEKPFGWDEVSARELYADHLVRLDPDDERVVRFGAKVPGHAFRVQKASMDFSYESFEQQSIGAYERVILDALSGDPTLFIRADEVGRSWRIVDPVLRYWAADAQPIPLYQAATWGPPEAGALITREGRSRRQWT